jgi:hypothetical protein
MTLSLLAFIWAVPFLTIALTLAVLMIMADWQSTKERE